MKHLKSIFALTMFSFFSVSCTQDSDTINEGLDLTAQISTSIKTQKANATYDDSKEGIYHGIFTSGLAQSNGMVWINLGNDTKYSAIVALSDGTEYNFELVSANDQETNPTSYKFVNEAGSFILDVSSPRIPLLKEATLNGLVHLGNIEKHTSQRVPQSLLGTFAGDRSGTWNLMYDDAVSTALGGETRALISVMVSWDPGTGVISETDTVWEPNNDCVNASPTVYYGNLFFSDPLDMSANGQMSTLFGVATFWSLHYNQGAFAGMGYVSCDPVLDATATSGVWSRGTLSGTILITP